MDLFKTARVGVSLLFQRFFLFVMNNKGDISTCFSITVLQARIIDISKR